jgi:rhodanese-related sulfurtransferase
MVVKSGHIENATFVENLASATEIPFDLPGCEGDCKTIVVYCRSGNRAGVAIDLMLANGFGGTLLQRTGRKSMDRCRLSLGNYRFRL